MSRYNSAAQAATWNTNAGLQNMGAVNQAWSPAMSIDSSGNMGIGSSRSVSTTTHFAVEKVDNGYILKSNNDLGGKGKVKICKDIDELKDLFVSTLVEYQLEK